MSGDSRIGTRNWSRERVRGWWSVVVVVLLVGATTYATLWRLFDPAAAAEGVPPEMAAVLYTLAVGLIVHHVLAAIRYFREDRNPTGEIEW